jgi:hypothetical protein
MKRQREGWCFWSDLRCPPHCPVPSIDNCGARYPGCALVRLKSKAEIEAELAAGKR